MQSSFDTMSTHENITHLRMSRHLLITAIMATLPTLADISLPGGSSSNIPASTVQEAEPYIQLGKDIIQAVKELTEILNGVKDTATADAAAPAVHKLTLRMRELQAQAEAMPATDAGVEALVSRSLNVAEAQNTISSFMQVIIRISMANAYNSEALITALEPLMGAMPQAEQ